MLELVVVRKLEVVGGRSRVSGVYMVLMKVWGVVLVVMGVRGSGKSVRGVVLVVVGVRGSGG